MNPMERGFTNPGYLLRSAILLLTVYTTYVTCQKTCVSGTCEGKDVSCLATVNGTCILKDGGSCWTTIESETVTASCSDSLCPTTTAAPEATTAAGAVTTSVTITNAPTTEAPTESPTAETSSDAFVKRKRRADTPPTLCCVTHMCNAYKSSAVRINVSLAMFAGVILLVGDF